MQEASLVVAVVHEQGRVWPSSTSSLGREQGVVTSRTRREAGDGLAAFRLVRSNWRRRRETSRFGRLPVWKQGNKGIVGPGQRKGAVVSVFRFGANDRGGSWSALEHTALSGRCRTNRGKDLQNEAETKTRDRGMGPEAAFDSRQQQRSVVQLARDPPVFERGGYGRPEEQAAGAGTRPGAG